MSFRATELLKNYVPFVYQTDARKTAAALIRSARARNGKPSWRRPVGDLPPGDHTGYSITGQ